jgi:hypothetical protein
MVNNSSSRLDATPNNNTIKKTTTPTWLFWNLEFIFERREISLKKWDIFISHPSPNGV